MKKVLLLALLIIASGLFLHEFELMDMATVYVQLSKRFPTVFRSRLTEDFRGKYQTYLEVLFNEPAVLKEWDEKIFKGKSDYDIVSFDDGLTALRAVSLGTSSALYRTVDIGMKEFPILSWDWRVEKFPRESEGDEPEKKVAVDFAGRVSAIFRGRTVWNSDVIQYVWDETWQEGSVHSHPLTDKIKIMVLKRGPSHNKEGWESERRDLVRDYRDLFGRLPTKPLGAIALMTDSDDTLSSSAAFYRKIAIEVKDH